MKIILLSILYTLYFILYTHSALALYDPRSVANNKMGVHILHVSELDFAAKLVNSNGGEWGYVIIPIQPTDRDLVKWQEFLHKSRELKVIPIIRITTIPQGGTWDKGTPADLVDFANFLNSLDWPVENRYIVLFNEVNRSAEWGGAVEPARYAEIAKNARTIFKERSPDFFILGPALDDALPDSTSSMSAKKYISAMYAHDPDVWSYFDGYAFHSYPNPAFSASPSRTGLPSIVSYRYLFSQFKLGDKPVFITETGWDQTKIVNPTLTSYWQKAWDIWNQDNKVAAVTPFVLEGGEVFAPFTLKGGSSDWSPSGQVLFDLSKIKGEPHPGKVSTEEKGSEDHLSKLTNAPWRASSSLLKLENIFRVILGLNTKAVITINQTSLLVEQALTPTQWEKGLSNRKTMGEIDGMFFQFPSYHIPVFWMKDTLIPLDMLWIQGNKIVEITHNVPVETSANLPTYSPSMPVDSVLELPAGFSEANNIRVGDTIVF